MHYFTKYMYIYMPFILHLKQYLNDIFQEYLRENGIPVDEDSSKGKKIKSKDIYTVHITIKNICDIYLYVIISILSSFRC